jgi:hypothetical protein
MSDDHGSGSGILEHFSGYVAGERSERLAAAVLPADCNRRPSRQ